MRSFTQNNQEININNERAKARVLRKSVWWKKKRSTGKCYYCQKNFTPKDLSMDHIIPLSKGGLSQKVNLVPCCKKCNNSKRNHLPIEWESYGKNKETATEATQREKGKKKILHL